MEIISIKQGTSPPTSEGLRFHHVVYIKNGERRQRDTGIYAVDEIAAYKHVHDWLTTIEK
jgi:hypothetical protein